MTLSDALTNLLLGGAIALVYLVVLRVRHGIRPAESMRRMGLHVGPGRYYGWAALGLLPSIVFCFFNSPKMTFEGSMLLPFIQAEPTLDILLTASLYGFVATGIPEELIFRGLIAGAIFRRLRFKYANVVQALIFLLPHALILLVAPALWPMLIFVMVLGLALGWLRQRADSIWPGVLLHAGGNIAGVLVVLAW